MVFKDFINCFAIKIEDHATIFDPAPWVSFQGDRYMGRDGSMYMLTDFPQNIDKFGNAVQTRTRIEDEGPPIVDLMGFRLVNSVLVHKAPIDDLDKVLYRRSDQGTEFFYLR